MPSERKLNEVDAAFERLEYPVTNAGAADEFDDVTLLLADGERNLGSLVERIDSDRFESAADLESALHNVSPREAAGEPYQSEGEG